MQLCSVAAGCDACATFAAAGDAGSECEAEASALVVRVAVTIAIVPVAATAVRVAARASLCMVGPFLTGEASTCEQAA